MNKNYHQKLCLVFCRSDPDPSGVSVTRSSWVVVDLITHGSVIFYNMYSLPYIVNVNHDQRKIPKKVLSDPPDTFDTSTSFFFILNWNLFSEADGIGILKEFQNHSVINLKPIWFLRLGFSIAKSIYNHYSCFEKTWVSLWPWKKVQNMGCKNQGVKKRVIVIQKEKRQSLFSFRP